MIYAILAITVITCATQAYFAWLTYKERKDILDRHALQIASLIQWVKDTPAASATVVAGNLDSPPHVSVTSDEDWFKHLDSLGVTE